MTPKQMREKRQKLVADFRAIYDRAATETRELTSDELTQARAINDEISRLKTQIDLAEDLEAAERSIAPETQRETRDVRPGGDPSPTAPGAPEYNAAVDQYLRHGVSGMSAESRSLMQQYTARNQNTISGAAGGYLVRPDTSLYGAIVSAMTSFGAARRIGATVLATSTGGDLPIPTNNDTANKAVIVSEEGSHDGGTPAALGQRILRAYMYSSKVVRVSLELLQDSEIDVAAFLARLFGERMGRGQSEHFTTGDGASKPQGYLSASQQGKETASTSAITFDEVMELFHAVPEPYRATARWTFADTTALHLRKLKNVVDGQYVWQSDVRAGHPDTLLGKPITINDDVPAIAQGARVMSFGDHSAYHIRDVRAMRVVRLDELYAATGQVGFVALARADGALIDAGTGPIKHLRMKP